MSAVSPAKLTRDRAWVLVLLNQFATPGLGSWLGRRRLAGAGQLLLSVAGFVLIMGWMCCFLYVRVVAQFMDKPESSGAYGWSGKWGLILFGASWVWSWFTSLSLLRETKATTSNE